MVCLATKSNAKLRVLVCNATKSNAELRVLVHASKYYKMWRIMARQDKIRTDGTSGGDDHFLLQIDKRISNALQNIQSTISSKVQKHMANEMKKIVKTERKLEHPDVKCIISCK